MSDVSGFVEVLAEVTTMAIEIVVPRLGWSMEEGTFGEWLKREGDLVETGEALFILEGEKSAQEVESLDRGILRIPPDAPRSGDVVRVGQLLGYLVAEGELAPDSAQSARSSPTGLLTGAPVASLPCGADGGDSVPRGATAGPAGDAMARRAATPRARRVARELRVDLGLVEGSGRNGRIRERDVRRVAAQSEASAATAGEGGERIPLSPARRLIAAKMSASARETATFTLTTRCDATNLVSLREQFCAAARPTGESCPGYTAFFVALSARALARHTQILAQWRSTEMFVPERRDISVAVDVDSGLVAPVVRDAHRLSLREIERVLGQLAEKARAGRLAPGDLEGGVFTVSNLGGYGIDAFTPIVTPPQSAVLGVGRIVREPAVVQGAVAVRDQVTLSLSVDHRLIDGAPAARFLKTLREAVENPGPWLIA